MSKTDKVLDDLHTELATTLLDKVRSGTAKASDLNVARQFLKDNGIDCVPTENTNMSKLAEELPFKLSDVIQGKGDLKQ